MPKNVPPKVSSPHRSDRTFRISLWIIGGLALAQVAAIAFAMVQQDLGNRDLADRRPVAGLPDGYKIVNSTSVPKGFPSVVELFDETNWQLAPVAPDLPEKTTVGDPINDPLARDKVEFAQHLRSEGDAQGALEAFRQASSMLPENAEILYYIASCSDDLDLPDQASDAWLSIKNLGPERAGEFYKFAELALLGKKDGSIAAPKLLTLSHYRIYQNPEERRGQMLTLRTGIKARPGAVIDPPGVKLRVLFYDLVNGNRIERGLNDDNYPQRAVTEPIDWMDLPPEEIIDFAYFREYERDQASGEQREFYGFVAELYYNDEWQDVMAHPRTLLVQAKEDDLSPMVDPGAPRIENSLFPQP
ncbi:MAG: hypothetical protein ACI8XO_002913 [Verrucomicrobiales bacterium]|jgi:hypothetical protein